MSFTRSGNAAVPMRRLAVTPRWRFTLWHGYKTLGLILFRRSKLTRVSLENRGFAITKDPRRFAFSCVIDIVLKSSAVLRFDLRIDSNRCTNHFTTTCDRAEFFEGNLKLCQYQICKRQQSFVGFDISSEVPLVIESCPWNSIEESPTRPESAP